MKKTNTLFWTFTGLFSALMIFTAIPDLTLNAEAKAFMGNLGYPDYFTRFIGFAKIVGSIAILIPISPRIKEWAYAGMAFDLIGAVYSMICVMGLSIGITFMLLPIGLGILSYIYFHKRLNTVA
ncbi:MAG: DoxX family protein [Bacteroidota bacterium]